MDIIPNKVIHKKGVYIMNKVLLVGRLAGETRFIQIQDNIRGGLRFTLAVRKEYLYKNGERGADFINVVFWADYGEKLLPYLTKGKLISVSGRLVTGSYTKVDGTRKYFVEVEADNIDFLGSSKSEAV